MVRWFEIPVSDMNRAKEFYDTVFDISIVIHDLCGFLMGWFPNEQKNQEQLACWCRMKCTALVQLKGL